MIQANGLMAQKFPRAQIPQVAASRLGSVTRTKFRVRELLLTRRSLRSSQRNRWAVDANGAFVPELSATPIPGL
jgi:hypothetical protein